jgi:hypothetical protein
MMEPELRQPIHTCKTRAEKEGFTALSAIKRDPAFSAVREHPEFERVASEARSFEGSARRAFEEAGGRRLLRM